ncbi:hypothetical protein [Streptantibioticus ferralitis]|uniref:Uncharacterized protein n=1 Tax=Streptantibioticus ferralitis TaxID=236510 RepID=A0ABT5Z054_9ACTN|nr:hypothetical protein [Streptantibioticus ferralitis]MDF2257180.1 hypothetical protein [Streptantibioticus ferralitis]
MSRPAPAKRPSPPSGETTPTEGTWAEKMERLRRRARPRKKLRVCDDDQLRQQVEEAEQAARRARFLAEAAPDDAQAARNTVEADAAVETARTALDDACDVLTFLALPRPVLEELISQHPPTTQQAADGAAFNPDTFPAALIAAASFDGMSEAEAAELLNTWSAPDATALWEAAWGVQQESRVELGKD